MLGIRVLLFSCLAIPLDRFDMILGNPITIDIAETQLILRIWQTLFGRTPEPSCRFNVIRFYTVAECVLVSHAQLRTSQSLFGCFAMPFGGLGKVPAHANTGSVHRTETQLSLCVTTFSARLDLLELLFFRIR